LNNGAALTCPVILQGQDQALKGLGIKLLHVEFARDWLDEKRVRQYTL